MFAFHCVSDMATLLRQTVVNNYFFADLTLLN